MSEMMTEEEAMKALKLVEVDHVRRFVKEGLLRCFHFGDGYGYRKEDIIKLMKAAVNDARIRGVANSWR